MFRFKKIISLLLAIAITFLISNCNKSTVANIPILTPTDSSLPTATMEVVKTKSPSQSLNELRQIVLGLIGDEDSLETKIQRYLASEYDDRIIVSNVIIPDEYDAKNDDSTIFYMYTNVYYLNEGNLKSEYTQMQTGIVKLDENDNILEIVTPDIRYDTIQQTKDICEQENLVLEEFYAPYKYYGLEYSKELSKMQSEIALTGGFDDFNTIAIKAYTYLVEEGYFENSTVEGAINKFYVEKYNFNPSLFAIATYHEYAREENEDSLIIYSYMYITFIEEQITDKTNLSGISTVIHLKKDGDLWYVEEVVEAEEGELYHSSIEKIFGEYADLVFEEDSHEKKQTRILHGEKVQEIINMS